MKKQKRNPKWYFKREKEIIEKLGLIPTKASGSGWIEKEDGYNDFILAQLKSTEANSFRLTIDDLKKLEYHAMVEHKDPLFIVDFINIDKQYLVINFDDLESIYNGLHNKKESEGTRLIKELSEKIKKEEFQKPKKKIISSGNKQKFWEDMKKEYENRRK